MSMIIMYCCCLSMRGQRRFTPTCSTHCQRQKRQRSTKTNLFWIEVADPLPGQVAFALNFGPIVQEEVCTPVMNTEYHDYDGYYSSRVRVRVRAPEPGQGSSHLLGSGATHSAITDTQFPQVPKSLLHRFPRSSEPGGGERRPGCSGSHATPGTDLRRCFRPLRTQGGF